MPFTPLHFGPALAVREAIGHGRFGIWAFTATQVLFDAEPGIRMLFDLEGTLHQTTHNPGFGVLYALVASTALWRWERGAAIVGAVFGSITHLWMDALFHFDVAAAMARWGIRSSTELKSSEVEMFCALGFVAWGAIWALKRVLAGRQKKKPTGAP